MTAHNAGSRLVGAPSGFAAAAAGAPPGRLRGRAGTPRSRSTGPGSSSPATSPPTSPNCSAPAPRSTASRSRPGTSRSSSAPTRRRAWCRTSLGAPASRRSSRATSACSTPRPATSGRSLLEALEQPHRSGRVRAAALTPFVGPTAAELAAGGDAADRRAQRAVQPVGDGASPPAGSPRCSRWPASRQDMPARMLGRVDGERRLTDLRHVGQALHAAALEEGLGLAALTDWLRRRRADTRAEITTDRVRRLETDAAATQVVTLHASKGLQYPVVYLPFAFDRYVHTPGHAAAARARTAGAGHRRVRAPAAARSGSAQALAEEAGEALRHLYVGLTRAQSQVVTWWAPTEQHPALRAAPGAVREPRTSTARVPDRGAAARPTTSPPADLRDWSSAAALVVEKAAVGDAGRRRHRRSPTNLCASAYSDRAWTTGGAGCPTPRWPPAGLRRGCSVHRCRPASGIARRGSPASAASRSHRRSRTRRGRSRRSRGTRRSRRTTQRCALRAVADGGSAGRRPRSAPWCTPSWRPPIRRPPTCRPNCVLRSRRADRPARRHFHRRRNSRPALLPVLPTPLGPLGGRVDPGATSPLRDRLPEMDFELPLAGGDGVGVTAITLGALRRCIRRHLAADDPLAGYADRLASPAFALATAARIPDRQPGRGAPAARPALSGRRLQDELARRRRRGPHCPPGTTARPRWTR